MNKSKGIGTLLKEYRKTKGLSAAKFARMYNFSQESVYKWEKGTVPSNPEEYQRLESILESGILKEPEPYLESRRQIKNGYAENAIPMYIGNTRAGTIDVYSDDPEMQTPVGHLPASVFPGCNHAEKIYGDSMYPLICNQAYVIGKVIDKKGIIWGEKYIIHTKYGQSMVKYVHPSDQGPAFIKIVSHNKTIPPQDINLDDITFVCRVHFIVNPS